MKKALYFPVVVRSAFNPPLRGKPHEERVLELVGWLDGEGRGRLIKLVFSLLLFPPLLLQRRRRNLARGIFHKERYEKTNFQKKTFLPTHLLNIFKCLESLAKMCENATSGEFLRQSRRRKRLLLPPVSCEKRGGRGRRGGGKVSDDNEKRGWLGPNFPPEGKGGEERRGVLASSLKALGS